jgi:hypothetical protein
MLIGKHVEINSSQVVAIIEFTFQSRDRPGMMPAGSLKYIEEYVYSYNLLLCKIRKDPHSIICHSRNAETD